jgi:glycosyltransferase involved in cell wall biosynthesis
MRILQVHNKYQNPGGEDVVVEAERAMLIENGHEVEQWIAHNDAIKDTGVGKRVEIALNSIWSRQSQREIARRIHEFEPDVIHVHNTLYLISPSIYRASRRLNVPIVQTLHNFRFICPASTLFRDGHVCEDCVGKFVPYPGVIHSCYRESKVESGLVAGIITFNRMRRTYQKDVDMYIALTEFAKQKVVEGGLPAEKIVIKPNFVMNDIEPGEHNGGYALFAGRLVDYKGVECLVKAWRLLDSPILLKIAGQGPLDIAIRANLPDNVTLLGQVSRGELLRLMQDATALIYPSECYETFGLSIVEAFSVGLPVIASDIGAPAEIITDGQTGWLFNPGDADDLARVVQEAWLNPEELRRRGNIARRHYLEKYTPERNHEILMEIYQTGIERFKSKYTTV